MDLDEYMTVVKCYFAILCICAVYESQISFSCSNWSEELKCFALKQIIV